MRALILCFLLVGPVSAQAPEPASERVTFTRQELDAIMEKIEEAVREREAAAFKRGQADVRERCPALI